MLQKKNLKKKIVKSKVPKDLLKKSPRKQKLDPEGESIVVKKKESNKKLHTKKKKVVSHRSEIQGILGAHKPPDEEESKLGNLIFGCNSDDSGESEEDKEVQEESIQDYATLPEKKKRKIVKSTAPEELPKKSPRKQKELGSEGEGIVVKNKQLHAKKKNVVSHLHEIQGILGASKPPDEKESELGNLIFGCNPEDSDESEEDKEVQEQSYQDCSTLPEKKEKKNELLPAWEDEDDEHLLVKTKAKSLKKCHRSVFLRGEEKYSEYVQEKFIKIVGEPTWAEIGREKKQDSDDDSDELLRKTGNFIKKSDNLPKGNIHIQKCPSLVDASMKSSMIKSVEFHPTSRVALVASTNGIVNLFQIDGKINAKIQTIEFKDFPIETAHFTTDGREIIAGSKSYAHFFSYDMFAGKIVRIPGQRGIDQRNVRKFHMSPDGKYIVLHGRYGNIHLITSKTKEWVGTLKMNGEVIAITFNRDGTKMYSHGGTGEVYVWDMMSRKCIHKFTDLGCITGTSLTLSPNEQFLATGSDSGIVNIYDHSTIFTTPSPEPLKALKNLTTEIAHLKFNSTSEVLSMSSYKKEEAVRLVHFPSLTVFSNFPTKGGRNSVRYANSVDFSENSGYFSIGNNVGTAFVFRLKHYKNY